MPPGCVRSCRGILELSSITLLLCVWEDSRGSIRDPPALGSSGVLSGVGGSWVWQLQTAPGWTAAIPEGASSPEDRNKTGFQEHSSNSH